jgi:hypothetical protein
MMKRQRGRGRKPGGGGGGHQPNRTLESTGPDMKVRGSASHIYEKYMQLSRDAASAGDRVLAESYMQHAEHYFRLLRAMQPAVMPQFEQRFQDYDFDEEGGAEGEEGGEGGEAAEAEAGGEQPYGQRPQQQGERRQDNRQDRPPRQFRDGQQQGGGQGGQRPEGEFGGDEMNAEGGEGGFRNNRRRRNRGRYRPDGERGPDGGGERGPRPEGGGQEGPSEGFGESVPAFLGGD